MNETALASRLLATARDSAIEVMEGSGGRRGSRCVARLQWIAVRFERIDAFVIPLVENSALDHLRSSRHRHGRKQGQLG